MSSEIYKARLQLQERVYELISYIRNANPCENCNEQVRGTDFRCTCDRREAWEEIQNG